MFCSLLAGCGKLLFSESTQYSARYSERAFKKVRQEMSLREVTNLLGMPLVVSTQDWRDAWIYSPGATGTDSVASVRSELQFDMFGPCTRLYFNTRGLVVSASGDYLKDQFTGMKKQELLQRLGAPAATDAAPFRVIFRYALPRSSGTYKRREVWFDGNQTVRSTLAELYVD